MKFIHYLETISGISIYPMFSLLVFVIFFVGMLLFVMRIDRKFIVAMSNLPLEADPTQDLTTKTPSDEKA